MGDGIRGRVEIKKENLAVRLSWRPDDSGGPWDAEALRRLLRRSGVALQAGDEALEKALGAFAAAEGPVVSDPVVSGTAPTAPVPAVGGAEPGPYPTGAERLSGQLLDAAGPPDVPDGADETVSSTGWAEKGQSVGSFAPGRSGRPGRGLDGAPIPPPAPESPDFLVGKNLRVENGRILAEEEGLVRAGEYWVDLIPCPDHAWSVAGGPEAGGCFLDFLPGHYLRPLPPETSLIAAAESRGYRHDALVDAEAVRAALAGSVEESEPLSGFPLSKSYDAKASVEIDPMRIRAELVLRKGAGSGKALDAKAVSAVLRTSGVKGMETERVKAEIMAFLKGSGSFGRIVLKEGRLPERGPDRTVDFRVEFLGEDAFEAARDRLAGRPDLTLGLASRKNFPPSAVTAMAPVAAGQVLFSLAAPKAGADGADIDGNVLPGSPGNDPDLRLHEGLRWDESGVTALMDGILDVGDDGSGTVHLRVRPHKDALVEIVLAENRMRATVSLRPPVGTGAPADEGAIRKAAEAAGVRKGILDEAVAEAAALAAEGNIVSEHLVAEGRLPMSGDVRLRFYVEGDPAKRPVPVKAGEAIGEIASGGEGGWTVLGEPLEAEGDFEAGENLERREEDGKTVLTALKSGHLHADGTRLYVNHELKIDGDVSLATGNIRFPGTIQVEGSVLSRVVVDAGDGIEVKDVVQAALLTAGGNLSVGRGIKGEGRAVLRAQGALKTGYAEEANLLVTGNIVVGKALLNCRIKCNGKIVAPAADGRVLGGVLKLKEGMDTAVLGSERGLETHVSFGQDYLVENQIDGIQGELRKLQEFIARTDAMMADLEKKGAKEPLIQVRAKKVSALKLMNKKNLRLFLLREKYEQHFASEVRVRDTVWPGVTFESHGRILEVREPLRGVVVSFDREKGRLVKRPI